MRRRRSCGVVCGAGLVFVFCATEMFMVARRSGDNFESVVEERTDNMREEDEEMWGIDRQ